MDIKIEKIGEVNFGKFKTEFKITSKTKNYLENENISLASLLPDGWAWYEVELFEALDENWNGKPKKEFCKKFEVIYYSIIESREYTVEDIIEKGFEEKIKELKEKSILNSEIKVKSVKNSDKSFLVKYITIKKR